ncbi:uncharacterized protein LOC142162060 [Nicotiana tabacum]|uniref:Uncharacterized protein LOC142162060 n=1 Tax=Nicotiana tabacum TaxID=4097 RepID=A0AC58RP08_TOBAC
METLAHYFKKKVQNNPKYKIKDMKVDLESEFSLIVNESKLKRVKRLVLDKLDGSYTDDYNKFEAYAEELRKSNPGSDVVINLSKDAMKEGKRRFLRLYVCFQALKEGWKGGLRPLIGLDDMQKGLLDAVSNVYPQANHRWCVRHIEANWSKKWKSGDMKKLIWWCAWSTYEEVFKDQLKKLGQLDEDAAKALVSYPPKNWCRAYFDTQCKNFMVDNNFTESFNSWIVEARQKPIIKMLEDIRVKVMNMLRDHEAEILRWKDEFSPHAMQLFKDYRVIANNCKVVFN